MSETPTTLVAVAHAGIPCSPPVVEGVEFFPHPEDQNVFIGRGSEEWAALVTRIPAFTRFGGKLPRAGNESTSGPGAAPAYDLSKPFTTWPNTALIAYAAEFKLTVAGKGDRADYVATVGAHIKASRDSKE